MLPQLKPRLVTETVNETNDRVKIRLHGLCEEAKNNSSVAYLQVRLKQILRDTRYQGLLKPLALQDMDRMKTVKFIYSCYLVVCNLKTERGIKRHGKYLFELEGQQN